MKPKPSERVLRVKQVDVFTDHRLAGNPLAVVLDGDGLTADEMQAIAREMNLSETTFVLTPSDPRASYKIRIFTPAKEIPFAGHPSIGTAFALLEEERIAVRSPKVTVHQETGIGVLPIDVYVKDGEVERIVMAQGRPEFGQIIQDIEPIAQSLGTTVEEIASTGLRPQAVSTGLLQLFVPMQSLRAVSSLSPDFSALKKIEEKLGLIGCCVFTRETIMPEASVHVRFFAPSGGVLEDPATGSAAGGLGAYLCKYGLLRTQVSAAFTIEQGYEIRRPSMIHVEVEHQHGKPTAVRVGGRAVTVLEGKIML